MKILIVVMLSFVLGAVAQYRHDLLTVRSILHSTAGNLTENVEQANALLDLSQQYEQGIDWRQFPDQR